MTELVVDGDELVIRLSHWERLGALQRGDIRVPLAAIESLTEVDSAYAEVRGFRAPGTAVPRRYLLGTWRRRGGKEFVTVSGHGPGVVVDLGDHHFDRLVISGPVPPEVRS